MLEKLLAFQHETKVTAWSANIPKIENSGQRTSFYLLFFYWVTDWIHIELAIFNFFNSKDLCFISYIGILCILKMLLLFIFSININLVNLG